MDYTFVENGEVEEILHGNVDALNEVLNRVYAQARQDMMREIPEIIGRTLDRQSKLKKKAETFFESHPDLKENRQLIMRKYAEAESEHPDWGISGLLEEAAKRARSVKDMDRKAEVLEKERREDATDTSI